MVPVQRPQTDPSRRLPERLAEVIELDSRRAAAPRQARSTRVARQPSMVEPLPAGRWAVMVPVVLIVAALASGQA